MKIAVIGSRERTSKKDFEIVKKIVENAKALFGKNLVVVSGGAMGPDRYAAEACKLLSVDFVEHPIDLSGIHDGQNEYFEFVKRAYERNSKIAKDSDIVFALVSTQRKGGTENTIDKSLKMGKKVYVVDGEGMTYLCHGDAFPS